MLTQALLQPLLTSLSRTLSREPRGSTETAAALLESFRPETPIQAMLAAQAIALHHAAMDCFGRAMQAGEDDGAAATRLQRNAASLTRAFTATLRTLQRCQAATAREKSMQREAGWEQGGEGVPTAPHDDRAAALPQSEVEFSHSPSHPIPPAVSPSTAPSSCAPSPVRQDPMQRESPAQRRWEELTEAEQFAILYPERVAAGATSHEDVDLWLPRITTHSDPVRPRR